MNVTAVTLLEGRRTLVGRARPTVMGQEYDMVELVAFPGPPWLVGALGWRPDGNCKLLGAGWATIQHQEGDFVAEIDGVESAPAIPDELLPQLQRQSLLLKVYLWRRFPGTAPRSLVDLAFESSAWALAERRGWRTHETE